MQLAHYQNPHLIIVQCKTHELNQLPKPNHITDLQTQDLLLEYKPTPFNLTALRITGFNVDAWLGNIKPPK